MDCDKKYCDKYDEAYYDNCRVIGKDISGCRIRINSKPAGKHKEYKCGVVDCDDWNINYCRKHSLSNVEYCQKRIDSKPAIPNGVVKHLSEQVDDCSISDNDGRGGYIFDKSWDVANKPFVAKDSLGDLVAAKVLLSGISNSATKRDGKSLSEIINDLEYKAKSCCVTKEDLINVSKMTLIKIFGGKE